MLDKLKAVFLKSKMFQSTITFTKTRSLPGFGNASIYNVAHYFKEAIWNGTLDTRSASLAFNFFLAVFPGVLFLFSLIPFVPIHGFLDTLLINIEAALPLSVQKPVIETLNDLINNEREGFLIFNIVLTLYFASNGVVNLMTQFNNTYLFKERRIWWKKRLIAIVLVLILTVLVLSAVILISLTNVLLDYGILEGLINDSVSWLLVNLGRWLVVIILFYLAISCLYYFGPAKRKNWTFFSAGSMVATLLIILTSLGFSYYINHFSSYNAIYGSIGTVIIIMLYFQLNSFILLLGFELNASIRKGKLTR